MKCSYPGVWGFQGTLEACEPATNTCMAYMWTVHRPWVKTLRLSECVWMLQTAPSRLSVSACRFVWPGLLFVAMPHRVGIGIEDLLTCCIIRQNVAGIQEEVQTVPIISGKAENPDQ